MKLIVAILVLAISVSNSNGQSETLRKAHFNTKNGLALDGYDPVSYFQGKPQRGLSSFRITYKAVTYHFVSASNLAKFKSAPDQYEPAYGGWCAYAMGENAEKVKIDPETFKILAGRLYLFYNFWGNNTLKDWEKDEKKLQAAADHNWKNIVR